MIENATVFDYITIPKAMHKSSDGHLFMQYYIDEKCLFFKQMKYYTINVSLEKYVIVLLIMYADTNLSTTLISLYILTSSMT